MGRHVHVARLARVILWVRVATVVLTAAWVAAVEGPNITVIVALGLTAAASYLPLRHWDRLSVELQPQRVFLAADVLLGLLLLWRVGPQSPFLNYTLTTSAIGGLLYGWSGAGVVSGCLTGGYFAAIAISTGDEPAVTGFQGLVLIPSLYPMAGAAGASVRRLIDQIDSATTMLEGALRSSAAAEERARIAREMHDSVAGSLEGLAYSATAVAEHVRRGSATAVSNADVLARSATAAAAQARALIADLREDIPRESVAELIEREVRDWSARTGIRASIDVDATPTVDAEARHEIGQVLREALRNVARHAHATSVEVTLRSAHGRITMTVADDGAGFAVPSDVRDLGVLGRFGLVGMVERARLIGGTMEVRSTPGSGTVVRIRAPARGAAIDQRRPA